MGAGGSAALARPGGGASDRRPRAESSGRIGRSSGSPGVAGRLPPEQVQQRRGGQPDDVEVVARDAPDQRGAAALDGVAAGPLAPLSGGQIPLDLGGGERPEG